MSNRFLPNEDARIVLNDSLNPFLRRLIDLSKPYNTIILIFEDEFSDQLLAAWAERDRLNIHSHKIGEVLGGIEVHAFGVEAFPEGSVLELQLRECRQDHACNNGRKSPYKSLLNELFLIEARLQPAS